MKKSWWLVAAGGLVTSLLWSSPAFAVGLGAFIDVSGGSGEIEWDFDNYSEDIDVTAGALGFVLDTSPTNQSSFNYRLNIGLASQDFEYEYYVDTIEATGIYFENIFGFALINDYNFRWWLGPLIRLGFFSGDIEPSYPGEDLEVDYAEFGIGAVTGINFNAGGVILSPSVGFRLTGFAGTGDFVYRDSFGTYYSYEDDFEGHTTTVFANFAVLF